MRKEGRGPSPVSSSCLMLACLMPLMPHGTAQAVASRQSGQSRHYSHVNIILQNQLCAPVTGTRVPVLIYWNIINNIITSIIICHTRVQYYCNMAHTRYVRTQYVPVHVYVLEYVPVACYGYSSILLQYRYTVLLPVYRYTRVPVLEYRYSGNIYVHFDCTRKTTSVFFSSFQPTHPCNNTCIDQ